MADLFFGESFFNQVPRGNIDGAIILVRTACHKMQNLQGAMKN